MFSKLSPYLRDETRQWHLPPSPELCLPVVLDYHVRPLKYLESFLLLLHHHSYASTMETSPHRIIPLCDYLEAEFRQLSEVTRRAWLWERELKMASSRYVQLCFSQVPFLVVLFLVRKFRFHVLFCFEGLFDCKRNSLKDYNFIVFYFEVSTFFTYRSTQLISELVWVDNHTLHCVGCKWR